MNLLYKLFGIHRHSWASWEVTQEGNLLHAGTSRVRGRAIVQRRKCSVCGKTELDSQEVYF